MAEIGCLQKLNHPNIVRLLASEVRSLLLCTLGGIIGFRPRPMCIIHHHHHHSHLPSSMHACTLFNDTMQQADRHFYLVLEYCPGGDLTRVIEAAREARTCIAESDACRVVNQLGRGEGMEGGEGRMLLWMGCMH